MPKQYDDTNTFVLYVNDKGGNEKRPDRTGKINIDGEWFKLAGWIRDGKNGKFLSGTVQRIDDSPAVTGKPPAVKAADDPNDEIPF